MTILISGCVSTPSSTKVWTNSLGMPLVAVPVGGTSLLISQLETQERDLAAFRGQSSEDTSPARHVSWTEAVAFCDWLTKKERVAGLIRPGQRYRLPTDHEWSCAAGIGHLESPASSPEAKSNRIEGVFPWGAVWPPPRGAGNLCGAESKGDFPDHFIAEYRDGLSGGRLKPRASRANRFGLHDLSGNVWEWCADRFREGTDWRVLRGGSWKSVRPETLLSSHRTHDPESYRSDSVGFRCVLAGD
ncbi:MAG: SUMF1/EgtB/PvdO family nonheme iron enzyme [Verrucomicrobiaceae bacterium]|nr:SUMF1/EgtB/PvdO family nonheme iron enzyme [Verrucomicrobiaceae bacterium]